MTLLCTLKTALYATREYVCQIYTAPLLGLPQISLSYVPSAADITAQLTLCKFKQTAIVIIIPELLTTITIQWMQACKVLHKIQVMGHPGLSHVRSASTFENTRCQSSGMTSILLLIEPYMKLKSMPGDIEPCSGLGMILVSKST